MMTAVIPRRSRPTDAMSVSTRGVAGVGLDRGEQLHDLLVLAAAAVGRQVRRPAGVDGHPDRAVLLDGLVRDGRRGPDRDLGRGVLAAPGLDAALEVEDDPRVGGLLQLELLDLDVAVAGGGLPVDAVHAVARGVWPDRRRERGRLQRPLRGGVAALEAGCRQLPHRQRLQPGVDHDADPLPDRGRGLEEPERVAGPDVQRFDAEMAAPGQRSPDEPGPLAATARA